MVNEFQGPVPQGASVRRFRETGRTSVIRGGKEILVKDLPKKAVKTKKTKKKGGILKGKILRKPKARGIRKLSAVTAVKQLADQSGPVVKEVPERTFEEPRSLFFREEFEREKRKSWI